VAPAQQALKISTVRLSPVFAVLIVVAAGFALLAGCGGDEPEPSPSPTASPRPTRTRTPAQSQTPTPGLGSAQFESARALEIARALSVDIGIRAAGTDGERQAANYLRDRLAEYGYDASLQPFPIDSFMDVNSEVDVLSPDQRAIDASALGGSTSGVIEARLVSAGLGYPQQFPTGTAGSIVLIERGEITFSEKVANATTAGAAGLLIYNNQSSGFIGQLGDESRIPAASIAREDGLALLDLISSGGATARLTVETQTATAESNNVIGRPPDRPCRIVIGGHYDSVPAGPGANDNASGTGVVIEMARAMAADGVFDDACFVIFGSEEIGLLGSAHFVGSLPSGEREAVEAMLNFDMLAVGDRWPFAGSPGVISVASQEADERSIPHTLEASLPENAASDHASFVQAGIPAMIFNCFCDPAWHTSGDTFDRINEERLAEAGAIGMGTAEALLAR
jgi:aminopeptidase YwaD